MPRVGRERHGLSAANRKTGGALREVLVSPARLPARRPSDTTDSFDDIVANPNPGAAVAGLELTIFG